MRSCLGLVSDQGGTSMIEFALIAPVLAALLVGTVDLSRVASAKLEMEQAAQRTIEGIQRSDYTTGQNAALKADAEAAAGAGSTATVTSWLECNNNGTHLNYDTGTCANASDPYARYVQVQVQSNFTPMFYTSYLPSSNADGTLTLTATAGVRTQ